MAKRYGVRFKGLICLMVIMYVLCACGNSNQGSAAEKEASTQSSSSIGDSQHMESSSEEAEPEVSAQKDKRVKSRTVSGFDEETNQTIVFQGIKFSFPAYFDVCHEDSTENDMTYYPEEKDYYAALRFYAIENPELSEETFEAKKMSIASEFVGYVMVETYGEGSTLTKSEATTIAGLSGWTVSCIAADGEDPSAVSYSFAYFPEVRKVIAVSGDYTNNDESDYDYLGDYEKIIQSATLVDAGETPSQKEKPEESTKSSDGIDPGFKAMMDSYEEFFNSYVEFMKKYNKSNNSMEMLMEYADFMKKYAETMEKLEGVNTEELSTEEYKYYMDVYSRITKKLLEVYES